MISFCWIVFIEVLYLLSFGFLVISTCVELLTLEVVDEPYDAPSDMAKKTV